MIPLRIAGANVQFSSPSGCSDISTLWVRRVQRPDGTEMLLSAWEPTEEELQALLAGGRVELAVMGAMLPPVSLIVTPPDE